MARALEWHSRGRGFESHYLHEILKSPIFRILKIGLLKIKDANAKEAMTNPKITFLTRHYPPNMNINGESVWDMVKYLSDSYGIESNVISIDRNFAGGGAKRAPIGNVIRLKGLAEKNNSFLRIISFLYEGFKLIKTAKKYTDSVIITTTSPPLLPLWGNLLLGKNVRRGVWTFDIFPEYFAAMGVLGKKNPIYKWILKKTYQKAPDFLITLGPKQAEYLQRQYNQTIPSLTLPCGVFFYQEKSDIPPFWWRDDKIFLCYCGNATELHNPDFIKSVIDNINPEEHRLVLALYGKHAPNLKEYAKDKDGVIIVDSVLRSHLHFIDIHLVTLRSEWTHLAVPSKAVSAISMGATILFCGNKASDNWYMLQDAGWFIDENNIPGQIEKFLYRVSRENIEAKKQHALKIHQNLKKHILNTYKKVYEYTDKQ